MAIRPHRSLGYRLPAREVIIPGLQLAMTEIISGNACEGRATCGRETFDIGRPAS